MVTSVVSVLRHAPPYRLVLSPGRAPEHAPKDHDAVLAQDARDAGLRMQAHMARGDREAARLWMDAMYALQALRARRGARGPDIAPGGQG